MGKNKLKPCPFCGSPAKLKEISGRWAVICTKNCAGTQIFKEKEKPIEVWNRRADDGTDGEAAEEAGEG